MASAPPEDEEERESFYLTHHPAIPYVGILSDGLKPGQAIVIKGAVLPSSTIKRFWIDLCCGLLVHGDHQDNKALHFNPRFETSSFWFSTKDTQIVLNSLINNTWGVEERYCNVFKEGSPFTIRILALMQYYKIAVNGRHLCDYLHRLNLNSVNSIFIGGNVSIDYIQIEGDVCF